MTVQRESHRTAPPLPLRVGALCLNTDPGRDPTGFKIQFFTLKETTGFSVELAGRRTDLAAGRHATMGMDLAEYPAFPFTTEERLSFLRLVILYLLSLVGIITSLSAWAAIEQPAELGSWRNADPGNIFKRGKAAHWQPPSRLGCCGHITAPTASGN